MGAVLNKLVGASKVIQHRTSIGLKSVQEERLLIRDSNTVTVVDLRRPLNRG